MENEVVKQKLEKFAWSILEKYFEKPINTQWRMQLRVTFESEYRIYFGNLYPYGGKRMTIDWDDTLSFSFKSYHLATEVKEAIEKEFEVFVENIHSK